MTKGASSKKRKVDADVPDEENDLADPAQSTSPVKRGPGRPRGPTSQPAASSSTAPAVEAATPSSAPAPSDQPAKRPRGRPKKIRTEEELAAIALKEATKKPGKRGRPRKKRPEEEGGEGGEGQQPPPPHADVVSSAADASNKGPGPDGGSGDASAATQS